MCVCVRPFYRGWGVRFCVCVYKKVRDKLGEVCAEVVMTLVCACAHFQVCMEPPACAASPQRQSSFSGTVACF